MSNSNKAVIIGSARIPFMKSQAQYQDVGNFEMMGQALSQLVEKFNLRGQKLDEVVIGSLMKHPGQRGLARESTLRSGLDPHTPAFDVERACGTSLEAAIAVANKINLGQARIGAAGGTDTNSDLPFTVTQNLARTLLKLRAAKSFGAKMSLLAGLRPADLIPEPPRAKELRTGLLMGEHCELMAKEWKISRAEQDQWSAESHQKAARAYDEGFMSDSVVEYLGYKKDGILRADTSVEKLARLKPAFDRSAAGTLTAGNSSALSDGAASVLIAHEDEARARGLPILARLVDAQSAAVDFEHGEGLLMAPTYAVAQMLKRQNLKLQDFDFYEIHEAFAAQVLCTLKAWESDEYCRTRLGLPGALGAIDRSKINVKGSSLAFGHPFAATGARVLGVLAKLLSQKPGSRGLISICTAGGMGVTAILEAP